MAPGFRLQPPPSTIRLVIYGHLKGPGVIAQVIVVNPEVQPSAVANADCAGIVANKKIVIRFTDAADERRRRTIRHRSRFVAGRIALTVGTVLPARPPADAPGRLHVNRLTGAKRDAGVAPRLVGIHANRSFAHAWRTRRRVISAVIAAAAPTGI